MGQVSLRQLCRVEAWTKTKAGGALWQRSASVSAGDCDYLIVLIRENSDAFDLTCQWIASDANQDDKRRHDTMHNHGVCPLRRHSVFALRVPSSPHLLLVWTRVRTMQKRRTHTKSRNGCTACKKSHAKCDELGPPCSSCALRDIPCVYTRIRAPASQRSTRLKSSKSDPVPDSGSSETKDASHSIVSGADRGLSRLLELELMNRWSTSTWKGSSSFDTDWDFLQIVLPQDALSYSFLLDTLLGAAALDLALANPSGPRNKSYVEAAMTYYDSSSIGLRAALLKPCRETHYIVVIVSQLLGAMNLCIPQVLGKDHYAEQSALERMTMSFSLLLSSTQLVAEHLDWLLDSPYPVKEVIALGKAPLELASEDVKPGLQMLRDLNEDLHGARANSNAFDGIRPSSPNPAFEYYDYAIDQLHQCFAEEVRQAMRGYYAGFAGLAGPQFHFALVERDPLALLIIMYWAIMIHNVKDEYWWATPTTGTDIAKDVELLLQQQGMASQPGWRDCINFVWNKIK